MVPLPSWPSFYITRDRARWLCEWDKIMNCCAYTVYNITLPGQFFHKNQFPFTRAAQYGRLIHRVQFYSKALASVWSIIFYNTDQTADIEPPLFSLMCCLNCMIQHVCDLILYLDNISENVTIGHLIVRVIIWKPIYYIENIYMAMNYINLYLYHVINYPPMYILCYKSYLITIKKIRYRPC